tara:strand:- start:271193 stop:272314 length:1122 start_codon:yes stop_codon:yes gene_type:complete
MSKTSLTIGIVAETAKNETRVAVAPQDLSRFAGLAKDVQILVEKGAGKGAQFTDKMYADAGAKLSTTKQAWAADVVLKINMPEAKEVANLKKGALVISLTQGANADKVFKAVEKQGAGILSLERIPRTSRAQAMDVLSSQANIAGYRAVLEATQHYGRFMPLMMTAAGSAKPARVAVLGAGVAGLQAIATAKRLGAVVEAYDVRPEVAEQIQSLGAKFMDLGIEEEGAGEGGYAKELSAEGKKKQQQALQDKLATFDIVITTAQIPGRPAPVLVTEATVKNMRPGSVIVDLAAATGGNCPLTVADKVTVKHDVILVGHTNYPGFLPADASAFFGRNLFNLLKIMVVEDKLNLNYEDDILNAAVLVADGKARKN